MFIIIKQNVHLTPALKSDLDAFISAGMPYVPSSLLMRIECVLAGPFLPCRDLFDWWTLRCSVWIVFLLALLGNGTVIFVLLFSRSKIDVPRFLVCNLAAADFFMGIYLGNLIDFP